MNTAGASKYKWSLKVVVHYFGLTRFRCILTNRLFIQISNYLRLADVRSLHLLSALFV